jgi:hypothetical protein
MQNDDELAIEYDADEARLFADLPRDEPVDPAELERLVGRLRREGFLHAPARRSVRGIVGAAAAAVVVFAFGVAVGTYNARRGSLEDMLVRPGLSVGDRVLVLQRAGSAYVRAAQSYADATANVDSSAVEVASKVLMGAAHAVARNNLDAGLSARLTTALQPPKLLPVSAEKHPIIWY